MKIAASVLVVATALLVAGCSSDSKSAEPSTSTTSTTGTPTSGGSGGSAGKAPARVGRCSPAPAPVRREISEHILLVGAELSHAQVVAVPRQRNLFFVSARVSGMDRKDAVATWMVRGLAGTGAAYAIDAAAALISEFGGATGKFPDLTVDAPGVQKSRICAGGPDVDPGVTAPAAGGTGTPG